VTGPKTNERSGTRAMLRGAPMSAYKIREVLDLIRGQQVERAADILRFCERGAAETVGKVLASAVANAAHNDELDPEELYVSACFADEGRTMRRMRPRARGRATRIRKRSAHITIIVSRLPEDRLHRLRARRVAEQAGRRARRVGGARGAAETAPERPRRTGRRPVEAPAAAPTSAPAHEPVQAGIADAELEAGIVDSTAAAVELDERGSVEAGAGAVPQSKAEEFHGAAEVAEDAGIVDADAAAVEAAEQHEIHRAERSGGVETGEDAEGSEK